MNAQLWTIPAEMQCYALLAAVLVLQLAHRRLTVPLATVAAFIYLLAILGNLCPPDWAAGPGRVQIETLVLSFMVGVCFYEFKEVLQGRWGAGPSAAGSILFLGPEGFNAP